MAKKHTILGLVLMALLAFVSMAVLALSNDTAVLAQEGEPEQPMATPPPPTPPPAPVVEPFVLTVGAHADTWVDEANPTATHGTDLALTVGQVSRSVDVAWVLVRFAISALPADADIISATVSFHSSGTEVDPFPIAPRAIMGSWSEASVTWDTRPDANSTGDPSAQYVPGGRTVFDVTNMVRAWHDGSLTNYGIALYPTVTTAGYRSFSACNSAEPPELNIYYTRRAELEPTQDTWVEYAQPSTAHGSENLLRIASPNHSTQERRLLVGFDFDSLPENIAVISATMDIFTQMNRSPESSPLLVADLLPDAILESWDEDVTWNTQPASVYLEDPPNAWVNFWNHWDVTNIVRSWALGLDPYGILVRVDPASVYGYSFSSRESSSPSRLRIAYGAAPPSCNPITSAQINGVSAGLTGVEYTFDAVMLPAGADPPDAISWQVTDYLERLYGESVDLSWDTAGEKTLWVVISHCGGTTMTSLTVTISEPPPACDVPIRGVAVTGPVVVSTGSPYVYRAGSVPINATDPVTFTLEATDQSPVVYTTDANYAEHAYTWVNAGSKTITVTAENCGGSTASYFGVQVVSPADRPDLLISTAWPKADEGRIYYVVHNQGNTAAPAGFYVSLELSSGTPAVKTYPNTLAAGGVGVSYLDYAWGCSSATADVGVLADWSEIIEEVDESNNQWDGTWTCDLQPPEIVGPEVVSVRETEAAIRWTTNEDCEGWLEYGTSPYDSTPDTEPSSASGTAHDVILRGLTAGTTYFVRAFCRDRGGLTANSEAVAFETAPPGSDPPKIRSLTLVEYPSSFYDFWELILEIEDLAYMDRVEFDMDGQLLAFDYSADNSGPYPTYSAYLSPAALGLTRAQFFAWHEFEATAYRQDPDAHAGIIENLRPTTTDLEIEVRILEPHNSDRVYVKGSTVPGGTSLEVSAYAGAVPWACTWSAFSEGDEVPPGQQAVDCDDLTAEQVDEVQLWIDGAQVDAEVPAPGQVIVSLQSDIGGLALGNHTVKVRARVGGKTVEEQVTLVVEQGTPSLEIERTIAREGNTLRISLHLHNAGPVDAYVMNIYDNIVGLEQVNRTDASGDYSIRTWDSSFATQVGSRRRNDVLIDFLIPGQNGRDYLTLASGADYTVSYVVVPVLFEQELPRYIGDEDDVYVELYEGDIIPDVVTFDLPAGLVNDPSHGMIPLANAVANAVGQADYVIVTNPRRIFSALVVWGNEPTSEFFSYMAELASLKNGVLGYLHTYDDTDVLDDLIEEGNYWADALNEVFNEKDDGYVLIVGETEVVASDYVGGSHFFTGPNIVEHVHDSDLWYANTRGETARPELVVGRVIGNCLENLNTYLENIIRAARGEPGYGFNRSRALLISGTEERHENNINYVADQMESEIADVNPVHWRHFDEDWAAAMQWTKPKMPDNGIIFYNGHGNLHQWCYGLSTWDVTGGQADDYDLGGTNPAVFTGSCKTGNYEGGDDYSLAEAFLEAGAGAYIGSTESVESDSTTDAVRRMYSRWAADESMGQALNQMKRAIWDLDLGYDHRKLWAFASNFYGDPKYGRLQEPTSATADGEAADDSLEVTQEAGSTAIGVKLPRVEFYQIDGQDYVELPGAGVLTDYGGYPVPVWLASVDFPAGSTVQDVQLVSRGQPVAYSGLSLPVNESPHAGPLAQEDPAAPTAGDGWYPELELVYDWSVEEGLDGATTLEIRIFPFYYNPGTTDALYYNSYKFSIETHGTTVSVESLEAGQDQYALRAPVDLELAVLNSSKPLDVIVQPSVRDPVTNDVLGGLPLQTLHGLVGPAVVDLVWDTRHYTAGKYNVVVELLDKDGHLLDKAVADVELGSLGARTTGLTADNETFRPGMEINLTLGVQNTGTVPIDGTGVFLVQRIDDLTPTAVITAPFTSLGPNSTVKLYGTWDTRGVDGYTYKVQGYAKFHGLTTEPRALTLYRPRTFLPLVVRPGK